MRERYPRSVPAVCVTRKGRSFPAAQERRPRPARSSTVAGRRPYRHREAVAGSAMGYQHLRTGPTGKAGLQPNVDPRDGAAPTAIDGSPGPDPCRPWSARFMNSATLPPRESGRAVGDGAGRHQHDWVGSGELWPPGLGPGGTGACYSSCARYGRPRPYAGTDTMV
jgi:hypothetical protein